VSRHVFDQVQTTPCGYCDVGPSADELAADILATTLRRVSAAYESRLQTRHSRIAEMAEGMLAGALVIARDRDLIDQLYALKDAAMSAGVAAEVAESSADFRAGYEAGYVGSRPGVVSTDRRAA